MMMELKRAKVTMLVVGMLTTWCSMLITRSFEENDFIGHEDVNRILTEVGRCTDPISDLKPLAGNWKVYMMGKKPPPGSDTDVRLRLEYDTTTTSRTFDRLIGTLRFSSGYQELVNLTQIKKTNVFVNFFFSGNPDWPKIVPVLLIGYDPERYVTFWQAGNGTAGTEDWALYVRTWVKELEEKEIAWATEGLRCLNLVESEE